MSLRVKSVSLFLLFVRSVFLCKIVLLPFLFTVAMRAFDFICAHRVYAMCYVLHNFVGCN